MDIRVKVLLGTRQAWIWQDDFAAPMWTMNIGNVRRQTRRWRMVTDAITAYGSMLTGHFGATITRVLIAGDPEDVVDLPYSHVSVPAHELEVERDAFTCHTVNVHTPFLARHEVNWSANPADDEPEFIYVDASFYGDGPGGVPVAAYAIRENGEVSVHQLETALTSVESEMQALQHAIMIAYKRASNTGKRFIVFSDCAAALVKLVLCGEMENAASLLGERVFVQWTPGHNRSVRGMVDVDKAARQMVRTLAAE